MITVILSSVPRFLSPPSPLLQDYDPYEENPGFAPFSEPETQVMRKLALTFDPHIWVNVHSGMEVRTNVKIYIFA